MIDASSNEERHNNALKLTSGAARMDAARSLTQCWTDLKRHRDASPEARLDRDFEERLEAQRASSPHLAWSGCVEAVHHSRSKHRCCECNVSQNGAYASDAPIIT